MSLAGLQDSWLNPSATGGGLSRVSSVSSPANSGIVATPTTGNVVLTLDPAQVVTSLNTGAFGEASVSGAVTIETTQNTGSVEDGYITASVYPSFPNNVLQLNFNEGALPLTVSGIRVNGSTSVEFGKVNFQSPDNSVLLTQSPGFDGTVNLQVNSDETLSQLTSIDALNPGGNGIFSGYVSLTAGSNVSFVASPGSAPSFGGNLTINAVPLPSGRLAWPSTQSTVTVAVALPANSSLVCSFQLDSDVSVSVYPSVPLVNHTGGDLYFYVATPPVWTATGEGSLYVVWSVVSTAV